MIQSSTEPVPYVTHLECSRCGRQYEAGKPHNLCECGAPLLVRYDLKEIGRLTPRGSPATGPASMWRYRAFLPWRYESIEFNRYVEEPPGDNKSFQG